MTIKKQKDDLEQKKLFRYYSHTLKPKTVLEIGSGYGRLAKLFSNSFYIGIDKNKQHLKKKRYTNRILMRAPYFGLHSKFDLVYSCTALMLNKEVTEIIKEMTNLSKRYIIFLETRKNLHWAYKHPYESILSQEGFTLEEKINLKTRKSPLTFWLFKRKR